MTIYIKYAIIILSLKKDKESTLSKNWQTKQRRPKMGRGEKMDTEKTDTVLGILGVALMIIGLPVVAIASRVVADPNTPVAMWSVLGFIFILAGVIQVRVGNEFLRLKRGADNIYLDYIGDYTG